MPDEPIKSEFNSPIAGLTNIRPDGSSTSWWPRSQPRAKPEEKEKWVPRSCHGMGGPLDRCAGTRRVISPHHSRQRACTFNRYTKRVRSNCQSAHNKWRARECRSFGTAGIYRFSQHTGGTPDPRRTIAMRMVQLATACGFVLSTIVAAD